MPLLKKRPVTDDQGVTHTPLSRKERKQAKTELHAKETALKNEIENLERVAELNEKIEFDYEKREKLSTINDIRYTAMYEDGICEICPNIYSFTVQFGNLMYQTAGEDEQLRMFAKYGELLNYFPHTVAVQLTVRNMERDSEAFFESIRIPLWGQYDAHAAELNEVIRQKYQQGDNNIEVINYMTVTIAAADLKEANTVCNTIKSDIRKYFKSLKCGSRVLSGIERLELLHSYFYKHSFNFRYTDLLLSGLTTKSYIAPEKFNFAENDYFQFVADGQEYFGQTIILKNMPPNMADTLISTLSDTKCDMTFNAFMRPVKHEAAENLVANQRAKMDMQAVKIQERNIQRMQHPGSVPFELRSSMENADNMLEDIRSRNQKLFRTTIMIYTCSDTLEGLQENVFKLKSAARKCTCEFVNIPEQQEAAFNSILPLGGNYIDIERNLTTANTAVFIPFTVQEIQHDGGLYYGQNALTKNLIIIDRAKLKNGNAVRLGVSGGGKSFGFKEEIEQVLCKYPKDEVIIIDPENEFSPLARSMDGEVIEISASSNTHLNMFDMAREYGDGENPLLLKGEFALSVFESFLGEITPVAKSILDKGLRLVYEPFFASGMNPEMTPTLKEYNAILKQQPGREAQELATAVELYSEGTLSAFSHRTNVNINKRFIVFNTFKLGGQLKTLGMTIVLDQIWNRAIENHRRGIRTWIGCDEMQEFFESEFGSNYFSKLWARFRKRNALLTGLMQNVQRLLDNKSARFILANSEMVVMLDQAKGDREALAEILDLSEDQQDYITNAEVGSGLIRVGGAVLPFIDEFPQNTNLYKIMSTKPSDQYPIM